MKLEIISGDDIEPLSELLRKLPKKEAQNIAREIEMVKREQLIRLYLAQCLNDGASYELDAIITTQGLAGDHFNSILSSFLNSSDSFTKGRTYDVLGKIDEAKKYYKKAIKEGQEKAKAYFRLGVIYADTLKFSKAEALYKRAIKEGSIEAKIYLAGLYSEEDPPTAIKLLEQAVKEGFPEANISLGELYESEGDKPKAIQCWIQATKDGYMTTEELMKFLEVE